MPVGEDQRQHLELTRNLAQRFNARFGPTLDGARAVHPQGDREDLRPVRAQRQDEQVARPAASLDLLAPIKASVKKIKSAVTDTEREIRYDESAKPGVSNLLSLLSVFTGTPIPTLEKEYEGKGYGDLKGDLAEVFTAFVEPVQAQVQTTWPIPPSWTGCWPPVPSGPGWSPTPRSRRCTRRSGWSPADPVGPARGRTQPDKC